MRYFFRRHLPHTQRLLLVESGSRSLIEKVLRVLPQMLGAQIEIDLVTCYDGSPAGFTGRLFNVNDYGGPSGRHKLLADLSPRDYRIAGIICAAEPIMTKWKWWLAWKLPAKFFIINENGDFFFFDWAHRDLIRKFVTYRAGLTGSAAVPAIVRLVFFPLTLAYLLLYAGVVHLRRRIRLLTHPL